MAARRRGATTLSHGAAVVGCGLIGRRRAAALARQGVNVVAVHDIDPAAAQAVAREVEPHPIVATSTQAAVSAEGVDLVVVATNHAGLVPVATAAIEAGRDVLVEKPGGRSLEEVLGLERRANELGRVVRVGYNHRFHPSIRRARELARSGAYGPVMFIRARYGHGGRLGYEREWRADRALSGGGELLDQGVHLIDLARWFIGDMSLAYAELRTAYWDMDVEDNAYVALQAADGAFAWLHASWTEWKNLFSFEVALRTAKLELSGLGGSYGIEQLRLYEMLPELGPPVSSVWDWPHGDESWDLEVADVLAAIRGQPAIGASIEDGVAVLRIVDEAYA